MADIADDPLSLLRHYHTNKLEITKRDGQIIFGEFAFPKNAKTNFIQPSGTKTKDYYTLETLVYFLENQHLRHPIYVRQAAGAKIPIIRRPDSKALLNYLTSKVVTVPSLDKEGPIVKPTKVKRIPEEGDDDGESSSKRQRKETGYSGESTSDDEL